MTPSVAFVLLVRCVRRSVWYLLSCSQAAGAPSVAEARLPGVTNRERFLAAVTAIGFVVPNAMVVMWISQQGFFDAAGFIAAVTDSLPARQFTYDLLISCLAFIGWTAWDSTRSHVRAWWVVIPGTFLVGLCFGIPLYLWMRERALRVSSPSRPLRPTLLRGSRLSSRSWRSCPCPARRCPFRSLRRACPCPGHRRACRCRSSR